MRIWIIRILSTSEPLQSWLNRTNYSSKFACYVFMHREFVVSCRLRQKQKWPNWHNWFKNSISLMKNYKSIFYSLMFNFLACKIIKKREKYDKESFNIWSCFVDSLWLYALQVCHFVVIRDIVSKTDWNFSTWKVLFSQVE